jgi:hypothetical protein
MLRRLTIAAAVLLGEVTLVHAGARRMVWLDPDASGTRPLLGLFASADAARACRDGVGRGDGPDGSAKGTDGTAKPSASPDAALRARCGRVVGLRHGTKVEFMPPPGACGQGLQRVRVLDGAYRGRIGCVRADALRVH